MDTIQASFCGPVTTGSLCYNTCNIVYHPKLYTCNVCHCELYEDFVNSLSDTAYNKHTVEEIAFAIKYFHGYLSEDELVPEQKTGRFWSIFSYSNSNNAGYPILCILLDNETVLFVEYSIVYEKYDEVIKDRDTAYIPSVIKYKKYIE